MVLSLAIFYILPCIYSTYRSCIYSTYHSCIYCAYRLCIYCTYHSCIYITYHSYIYCIYQHTQYIYKRYAMSRVICNIRIIILKIKNCRILKKHWKYIKYIVKWILQAGIVKWYNGSLVMNYWEFDSPYRLISSTL